MSNPRKNQPFEHDGRVIANLPKNNACEVWVAIKEQSDGNRETPTGFIDIREMWFNNGPTHPPRHTRKGCMVPRAQVPKMIVSILRNMKEGEMIELREELLAGVRHVLADD